MDTPALERAKAHFLAGVRCHEAGQLDVAERHYQAALRDAPGRPSTLTNLAAVSLQLGKAQAGLDYAQAVLAVDARNPEALRHQATALAELGQHHAALQVFSTLVQIESPPRAASWTALGHLRMELGDSSGANEAFEQAMALGADLELHAFYRAVAHSSALQTPPRAPPRAYVEALFDRYATHFDRHLVDALGYDAPARLMTLLPGGQSPLTGPRFDTALDLGCGTGLCAPALRACARRVVGVDLSAGMLARARALGLYEELHHADIHDWLARCQTRFDLIMAADVLIYVGALDTTLAQVARVLAPRGWLLLSVESPPEGARHGAQGFVLQASARYAHTLDYVRTLAAQHHLHVAQVQSGMVRRDAKHPVAGHFMALTNASLDLSSS